MKAIAYPGLLTDLAPEQFEALKADIAKRGVKVPIELDAVTGEVVDGYHRLKACEELGVKDIPTVERRFASEAERKEHALKLNLLRRHIDAVTWAEAFEQLLDLRGVKRGQGARNDKPTSATIAQVAEELGVPRRTAFQRLQVKDALANEPELTQKVKRGEIQPSKAIVEVKKRQKREELERKTAVPQNLVPSPIDGWRKMCGVRFVHDETKITIYELRIGPTEAGMRIRELRQEMESKEVFRSHLSTIEEMKVNADKLRKEAERLEVAARKESESYERAVWRQLEEEHGGIQTGTEVYSLYVRDPKLRGELAKLGKEDAKQIGAILFENWASGKLQCVARGINGAFGGKFSSGVRFSLPGGVSAKALPEGFPSRLPSGHVGWTGIGDQLMADEDQ